MPPPEKPRRFELSDGQKSTIIMLVALVLGAHQLIIREQPDPIALTFVSGLLLTGPARAVDRARAAVRAFTEDKR